MRTLRAGNAMSGRRRISNPLNPSMSVLIKLAKILGANDYELKDAELAAWHKAMRRKGYINE